MTATESNLKNELQIWQDKLYRRSLRRQTVSAQIQSELGSVSGQHCLEVSAGDAGISTRLHSHNETRWETVAVSDRARHALESEENPAPLTYNGQTLPFEENTFDLVVIVNALECVTDDSTLIKECHRVLKRDGRLILCAARQSGFGTIGLIRGLFGNKDIHSGRCRRPYNSHELFDILKDGFDVPSTQGCNGFFTELSGAAGDALARLICTECYWLPPENAGQEYFYRYQKLYVLMTLGRPLIWLARQLDRIFFFQHGSILVAKTKPRAWRPRRIPTLVDGRSIAEAAINTKIGTAAPF